MINMDQLKTGRSLLLKLVNGLSLEQTTMIPTNFNNNILWHLGHIFIVGENLINKLSGLPVLIPENWGEAFGKDSSPKTWKETPDLDQVKYLLMESILNIEKQQDLYTQFKPYTTSAGIAFENVNDALRFLSFHDGIHLGYIMAQKHLIN